MLFSRDHWQFAQCTRLPPTYCLPSCSWRRKIIVVSRGTLYLSSGTVCSFWCCMFCNKTHILHIGSGTVHSVGWCSGSGCCAVMHPLHIGPPLRFLPLWLVPCNQLEIVIVIIIILFLIITKLRKSWSCLKDYFSKPVTTLNRALTWMSRSKQIEEKINWSATQLSHLPHHHRHQCGFPQSVRPPFSTNEVQYMFFDNQ